MKDGDGSYNSLQLNKEHRRAYYKDVIVFLSRVKNLDVDIPSDMDIDDLREFIDYLLELK